VFSQELSHKEPDPGAGTGDEDGPSSALPLSGQGTTCGKEDQD